MQPKNVSQIEKSFHGFPLAASAWIVHETGLILAVSRKHDETDLGLPGGKLDPGETFHEAVVRETKEETNLDITDVLPVFDDVCGTLGIHHVHWCMTFLCKAKGTLKRMEKGRVVWVPPQRLITRPDGSFNSFGQYNLQVQKAIETIEPRLLDSFKSSIPLESEFLL